VASCWYCRFWLARWLGWHLGRGMRVLFPLVLVLSISFWIAATLGSSAHFLNWPTMFGAAFLFLLLLRGLLSESSAFLKKLVKLGISVCLLAAFSMLMNWGPLWSLLGPFGFTRNQTGFHLIVATVCMWWISVLWITLSRPRRVSMQQATNQN
jgi:hypothetical protein